MITEAEIKRNGAWETIGFDEAVHLRSHGKVLMRCPRCHGEITPYDGGGARPHFGHLEAHKSCAGTLPKLHPKALP